MLLLILKHVVFPQLFGYKRRNHSMCYAEMLIVVHSAKIIWEDAYAQTMVKNLFEGPGRFQKVRET